MSEKPDSFGGKRLPEEKKLKLNGKGLSALFLHIIAERK